MSRFIILHFFYRAYITFVSKFLRILDLITLATIMFIVYLLVAILLYKVSTFSQYELRNTKSISILL